MAIYKNIILEEKGGVSTLTLNNPENRNPLTEETKEELTSALNEVEINSASRAMVLTGRGLAFCAGGDLKKVGTKLSSEETRRIMVKSQKLLLKILNLEKPVIAAINGDAIGMGFNLALAADFIIASEKAKFSEIFIKIGLMPDFGALYFLPRLIGPLKSRELVYFGTVINAEEAFKIGLVYKVVPHDNLEKESYDIAKKLANMPTQAIGKMKRVINQAFNSTLTEVLEEEIKAQIFLTDTEDYREGIRAFMEKRPPVFKGK